MDSDRARLAREILNLIQASVKTPQTITALLIIQGCKKT